MSARDAILAEAYARGRRDGKLALSVEMNDYPIGSAEHAQYMAGRASAIADANRYADAMSRRAAMPAWERESRTGGRDPGLS